VSADDEADARPRGVPCLVDQLIELRQARLGLLAAWAAAALLAGGLVLRLRDA